MLAPTTKKNRSLIEVMTDPFDILSDVQAMVPKSAPMMMKTDVKETDKGYELSIDLPGYSKENVKVELQNGYLCIEATQSKDVDEKSEDGTYIRKERFSGKSSRSFYVGDDIKDDEITAKFDNGVLKIDVPKKEEEPKAEEKKQIAIEG